MGETMRRLMALVCLGGLLLWAAPAWAQSQQPSSGAAVGAERSSAPVGEERKEEKKAARPVTTVEQGGALLPAWRLVVEPFFEYDHISSQNVSISGFSVFEAILIGQFSVNQIKRDIFIPGVNLRLGMKRAELSLRIPYYFESNQYVSGVSSQSVGVEKTVSDNSLGDLESYLYYQLLKEGTWRRWVPDTVVRVGARFPTGQDPYSIKREYLPQFGGYIPVGFPTGTGAWGTSVGVTFIKSADPAVLFVNFAYYYNFARDVGVAGNPPVNYGDIKLGNTFEYSIGLIFALQERLSLNFSLLERVTTSTTSNGRTLPNTNLNAIVFNIGSTYVVSPRFTLDFLVGIGLSDDAPQVSALVRMPISFQF
jgi:hypothetical protein